MRAFRPLALLLATLLATSLTACDRCDDCTSSDASTGTGSTVVAVPRSVHHEDGTVDLLAAYTPSTPPSTGATVTPPAAPVVPDQPIPVAAASTLWLVGKTSGAANLGEIYQVALDKNSSQVVKTFTGRPWMSELDPSSVGLVFNPADNRFYGVMTDIGVSRLSKLVAFDPATDAFEVVKTLSDQASGKTAGLGSDTLADGPRGGYYRKPALSADGKSMLLLAERGGRDDRGLLVHVNLDKASAGYLRETIVYDFIDHELAQGDYCKGLVGKPSELAWGKDSTGNTVLYMGRNGISFVVRNGIVNTAEPTTCPSGGLVNGVASYLKQGRVFALKPSNAADLAQPWGFVALGNHDMGEYSFHPLLRLGRQMFYDLAKAKLRWTTETLGGGQLGLYLGSDTSNPIFWGAFGPNRSFCYRLGGFLPQVGGGDAILTCSGLNGVVVDPAAPEVQDQVPLVFTFTGGGGGGGDTLSLKNEFADWFTGHRFFGGTTYSTRSRLLFASSIDIGSSCLDGATPCSAAMASTLEELNPAESFYRRLRVTGDVKTTGLGFAGDPAVGGPANEPIPDRYIVWLGTTVSKASMTINKHDRLQGTTTSLKLDTDAGAYPWGRLLDLGNGLAMARIDQTPPAQGSATDNPDQIGGYRGHRAARNFGSQPGLYTIDVKTGQVLRFAAQRGEQFSSELARTDDGSVWGSRWQTAGSNDYSVDQLRKIDPATGTSTLVFESKRAFPNDRIVKTSPAARGGVVYHLGEDSSVYWAGAPTATNFMLTCVRADDNAVRSNSGTIGPVQQTTAGLASATGGAHRPLIGATWSPRHDAMYLITTQQERGDGIAFLEIDKGVAPASLCRQPVTISRLVASGANLADLPSTKLLATQAGLLVYGTASGKLMAFDPTTRIVRQLADLKALGAASAAVKGFLTEVADGVIAAVVYDYDAQRHNTGRRLAGVSSSSGAAVGSHDISKLIGEREDYPGVNRFN